MDLELVTNHDEYHLCFVIRKTRIPKWTLLFVYINGRKAADALHNPSDFPDFSTT
jgi:hypothetical protein